jgi:hypothetical protein
VCQISPTDATEPNQMLGSPWAAAAKRDEIPDINEMLTNKARRAIETEIEGV